MILPATGGISYNVRSGDSAFGWSGDHVEPGVSIRNREQYRKCNINDICMYRK